jgi:MFS family permease
MSPQASTRHPKRQVDTLAATLRRSPASRAGPKADTGSGSVHVAEMRDVVGSRRHRLAFWTVSFAFLAAMAFSAAPSPLYGLYRARDHFSVFMVTVAYAAYSVGVIGALLLAGHLSDWFGRRRLLLPALGTAVASAIVFVVSKSLAGLLVGRLLNGIAIGIVVSTATAYLAELHAVGRPDATPRTAQLSAAAIPVGGIGLGALIAGILAEWVAYPLTVPYLVFLAALLLGTLGVALSPETREAVRPRPHYRPQRVSVPHDERSTFFAAALSAFMAFATLGLFTGLVSLFLAVTLHHSSHALAGAVLCAIYASAVTAQILTAAWPVTREFEAGMAAMVIGLGVAVLSVWLHPPSLALFIAAGTLIGAGGGTIFRGAVGTVMSIAPPDRIAESLAGMFIATFVGLSLPAVGVGITLSRHVSPKDTILGFAIAASVGIAASAIKLVDRRTARPQRGPRGAERGPNSPDARPGYQPIAKPEERRAT